MKMISALLLCCIGSLTYGNMLACHDKTRPNRSYSLKIERTEGEAPYGEITTFDKNSEARTSSITDIRTTEDFPAPEDPRNLLQMTIDDLKESLASEPDLEKQKFLDKLILISEHIPDSHYMETDSGERLLVNFEKKRGLMMHKTDFALLDTDPLKAIDNFLSVLACH